MNDDAGWPSFSAWVEQGRDRWLRAAYLITGDLHRSEDLVQDALVEVAKRWSKLRSEHPDAYLRRCLYNGHSSWWRRRRDVIVETVADRPYEQLGSVESRVVLTEALARLTPKQRAVLVLRFYEDQTEAATAEVLRVSVGTVKSQTHAALRRLRESSSDFESLIGREEQR